MQYYNFTYITCYNYFYKKKLFKIKIDEIILKVNYVTRRLSDLTILLFENDMFKKLNTKT